MKMKNRFIAFALSCTVLFQALPASAMSDPAINDIMRGEESQVVNTYTVPLLSSESKKDEAEIYEYYGKFYMDIHTIAELTRFELSEKEDILFGGQGYVLKQGIYEVAIAPEYNWMYSYFTEFIPDLSELDESVREEYLVLRKV